MTIIYDLSKTINLPMILFADESMIIYKLTLGFEIKDTIKTIIQWLLANNLNINLDKNHIMTFKNR